MNDYSETVLYDGSGKISKLMPDNGAAKCAANMGELQDMLEEMIRQK